MASQAQIDSARASLDQLDSRQADLHRQLHGAKFDTALDAIASIKGNFNHTIVNDKMLKVEGGFTKIQVGVSNQIVVGFKGEYVNPYSISIVLGAETKMVVGVSNTVIDGAKSDTIVGAKVDLLAGIKYERKADQTFCFGGSPKLESQGRVLNKMNTLNQKVGNLVIKATRRLFKSIEVQETIGTATEKIDELTKKHTSLKEQVAAMKLNVGNYKFKGDTVNVDYSNVGATCTGGFQAKGGGGFLNMFPSSQAILDSAGSFIAPGNLGVSFKGTLHRLL